MIYQQVHALLTRDLVSEYYEISHKKFVFCTKYNITTNNHPAFYGCEDRSLRVDYPCFNWRKTTRQDNIVYPIYHISFKRCTKTSTGFLSKHLGPVKNEDTLRFDNENY